MLRVLHCGGISKEKPRDFETFLTNDANKKLLLEVLLKVQGISGADSYIQNCVDATLGTL